MGFRVFHEEAMFPVRPACRNFFLEYSLLFRRVAKIKKICYNHKNEKRKMLKYQIKSLIQQAIQSLQKKLGSFEAHEIAVEHPENSAFGDYSTNISMRLARVLKKSPMEIGEMIKDEIKISLNPPLRKGETGLDPPFKKGGRGIFQKIEVVPPGFINFFIAPQYLQKQVPEIIKQGEKFSRVAIGKGKKAHIDFLSANPTGPLQVGNGQGGFFGDVLGNILEHAGYKVTKEYYINDYGGQIEKLGHSVLKDEHAVYRGDYIDYLHKKIKTKDYRKAGEQAAKIIMKEMIQRTIENKMKITFDNWFRESSLHKKSEVQKILTWLQKKNLVYEKENAIWFKSSQYGDDKDRVFKKKDGGFTYMAGDFAYHKNKLSRKFDKLIDVWGSDHHGDVARIKAAVEVLSGKKDKLDIILCQLVRLMKDGKEVRMSKRTGNYVTIEELIGEVGVDVARFFFLMRSPDSHLDFDLNLAKEQSDKNPVFYIQYAHARICSILKKAKEDKKMPSKKAVIHYELLTHPSELALMKEFLKLPELVEEIAQNYNVHKMPHYALHVAQALHSFYKNCKVLEEDSDLRNARINLIMAAQIVLKKTLQIMGISVPERM